MYMVYTQFTSVPQLCIILLVKCFTNMFLLLQIQTVYTNQFYIPISSVYQSVLYTCTLLHTIIIAKHLYYYCAGEDACL